MMRGSLSIQSRLFIIKISELFAKHTYESLYDNDELYFASMSLDYTKESIRVYLEVEECCRREVILEWNLSNVEYPSLKEIYSQIYNQLNEEALD